MEAFNKFTDFLYTHLQGESLDQIFQYILSILWILPVIFIAQKINKKIFKIVLGRMKRKKDNKLLKIFEERKIFVHLSHYIPGILTLYCASFIGNEQAQAFVHGIGIIYLGIITIVLINAILNVLSDGLRNHPTFKQIPINSYIQVAKIVLFTFIGFGILVGVVLDEKTVLALIGSIGGFSAFFVFIFKDTLAGFLAGIILTANEMVSIGDWICVPGSQADGEVVDMTLNTVKIKNWDSSITTVPPLRLLNDNFINWDVMQNSNARRMKRAIFIDLHSIKFMDEAFLNRFQEIEELGEILKDLQMKRDITGFNRITNVTLFRHYYERYLKSHQDIRQDLTCMVRELAPTSKGLPIEAYGFTMTSNWIQYEKIQADITDHMIGMLTLFELEVFQEIGGADFIDRERWTRTSQ